MIFIVFLFAFIFIIICFSLFCAYLYITFKCSIMDIAYVVMLIYECRKMFCYLFISLFSFLIEHLIMSVIVYFWCTLHSGVVHQLMFIIIDTIILVIIIINVVNMRVLQQISLQISWTLNVFYHAF